MPSVTSFLLAGNASYSNRGCEAIVRGTVEILRHEFGDCEFFSAYFPDKGCRDEERETDDGIKHIRLGGVRRFTGKWLQYRLLQPVSYYSAEAIRLGLSDVAKSGWDCVLMVGGDNYTLDYGYPLQYFRLNSFALHCKKPVVLWGASVGPFSMDPEFERWAAEELRRVDRIYARETATLDYLRSIGVEENVRLAADPAFWMPGTPVDLPAEVEEALVEGCLGINLSPLLAKYRGDGTVSSLVPVVAREAERLIDCFDGSIMFIPHVTSDSLTFGYRDDDLFLEEVISQMKRRDKRLVNLGRGYNASQLKWIISRLRAFVGARTHATLAAVSSCVPTLFVAYSMKAKGIARDIFGHESWVLGLSELESGALPDHIVELLSKENEIRAYLAQTIPEFRERALVPARDLRGLIK